MDAPGPIARLTGGGAQGIESYTRISLYVVMVMEPLILLPAIAISATESTALALAVALLAVVHPAACIAVLAGGLARRPWARLRARLVVLAAVTATGVVLALTLVPGGSAVWYTDNARATVLVALGAFTLAALAPVLHIGALSLGVAATAAVVLAGQLLDGRPETWWLVILVAVIGFGFVASVRLSVWILEIVRELDASRDTAARLAVAEERLRIARDIHDVVGRALSVVAVKSELAAQLARRGDDAAVREMLEVHELAHDAQREVRGVVAGYRSADLDRELAGARTVLAAAGIETRVDGAAPVLEARVQETLAWVVREAVTNVVRHSSATACTIEIGEVDDGARLRIVNDGARPAGEPGGGSGLAGLAERLAAVGGTLATTHVDGRFELDVRVPREAVR